ncbi:MAG: hypothetical protein NTW79_01960 [Candidatus Berkelbacteria bacterium]|nr:hypothetical protein [Candidatus Berkelbacteria bacterium]
MPSLSRHGKEILSEAEQKAVAGIPMIRRIRPVVVQPQTVRVAIQVEDIRLAVTVCYVRFIIYATANEIKEIAVLYLIWDQKSLIYRTKFLYFFVTRYKSSAGSLSHRQSQPISARRVSRSLDRLNNQSV